MASLSDTDEDEENWEKEEDGVVGRALQKCSKISAELRKDLYCNAKVECDRYAEVDVSHATLLGMVTQDTINEAWGADDSDFQPLLKPYQLVGVNFLLLLNREDRGSNIG